MATYLTEGMYPFEFLIGERETIQVDKISLASGQNLAAGAILARTFVGTGAGAMDALVSATGNPTVGAVTVGDQAEPGDYPCWFVDATHCDVFSPSGEFLGALTLGAAFSISKRIGFTISAGNVAAQAGDVFVVTVTEGASTYKAATGSDAVAILGIATDASLGAVATIAVTRLAEFDENLANYGAMDAGHKALAKAALARKLIVARSGI